MSKKWSRRQPNACDTIQNRLPVADVKKSLSQCTSDQGVEHFALFENLVFTITSKESRIPTEHTEPKDSLDSKLQIQYACSIEILSVLKVITKTSFSKIVNSQP